MALANRELSLDDADAITEGSMGQDRILVIGDSHCAFWSGRDTPPFSPTIFEGVDIAHVGAATAYNLMNDDSTVKAGQYTRNYLRANHSRYGCIMLSFGEIDCRVHVIREAINNSVSINEIVENTVVNYIEFVSVCPRTS